MASRQQWRVSPPSNNNMTSAAIVRELARAAETIDRTKRRIPSLENSARKGCEKAVKMLNGIIVELLAEKEVAG